MKNFIWIFLIGYILSKIEITEIIDNFDTYHNHSHYLSNWKSTAFGFEIMNNKLVHIEKEFGILIWKKSEYAYDTYFELDILVEETYKSNDWEFIGAAIYKNENEYYAVQLVENKLNGNRYPELKIVSDIQDIGKTISCIGYDYFWDIQKNYKLIIEIEEGNGSYKNEDYISIIKAQIYDSENKLVYENIYGITNKNALLFGKAAITSCHMKNNIFKAHSKFSNISNYNPRNSFPEYNYKNYCSKTVNGYKLPKGKKNWIFPCRIFF